MTKISILEQLKQADAEGYAIPHFNYSDIWDMTAIVRAAEEMHSPVMLAGVPKVTNALTMDTVAAMAHSLADNAKVPVYLHLDHSTDPQICKDACDHHFDTVMIDGSKESLERNIEMTADVVSYAHPRGIFVEGEIGKIAALMNATKEKKTPLQVSLDKFGSQLAIVIMIISAVVFVLSLYRKMPVLDSLMFAVALAVAAIPEALSSIVTIVQAMGTQKMAREHAIIKDLKAVESLGCVSVICSDKTGTLTQNKMTVQQVYINHQTMEADALDLKQQSHRYLLYDAILTNDSAIVEGQSIGDPTEVALLEMGRKADIKEDILKEMMPRMEEIPFDSDRKLMSTCMVCRPFWLRAPWIFC